MTTSDFDRKVSILMDCGAMNDKNWPTGEIKNRTKLHLKRWEKMQRDIAYTKSSVTYVQLKEDRKEERKNILEAVKQGDINTFTVIKSHENHHVIINECGKILGYRYHIKHDLLRMLEETTEDLPRTGVNASN